MKSIRTLSAIGLILSTLTAHALRPSPGWYAGGMFGVTYAWGNTYTKTYSNTSITSSVGYDVLINAAPQFGYRFDEAFRGELELLYNKNPYSYIKVNNVTFHNHTSSGTGYTIQGATTEGFGFFNGFYDYLGNGTRSLVPYLGLGAGYAYVYNVNKLYSGGVYVENSERSTSSTTPAGQIILGVSTYLDDFTSLSLDTRFIGSGDISYITPTNSTVKSKLKIASVNVLFNGAFNAF